MPVFLLLLGALGPPAALQAPPAGEGVESLAAALRERTSRRRAEARAAWREHASAYLKDPSPESRAPLLGFAPEIQEPALEALAALLETEDGPAAVSGEAEAILDLLDRSLNPAGAERLASLLPGMPPPLRQQGLEVAAAHGSRVALDLARAGLEADSPVERGVSLAVLLAHGPLEEISERLTALHPEDLDEAELVRGLARLAERDLPADFPLPPALLRPQISSALAGGVLAIMAQAPQPDAEPLLLALVLGRARPLELRLGALPILEAGAGRFRWRAAQPALETFLEDNPKDRLAAEVAWLLHRLGEKAGARFLLATPLARLKSQPRSPVAHFSLGELYVRLGQHQNGYRAYRDGFALIRGTSQLRRTKPATWFMAARAAAGARRFREAAEWLQKSAYTPEQLAPYRQLPEFQPVLGRKPFKALFGLD